MDRHLHAVATKLKIEVEPTDYGFRYVGIRQTPNGHQHVRLTQYVLPNISFIAGPIPETPLGRCSITVPIDDENCWHFSLGQEPRENPRDEDGQRTYTLANDYLIDRELQRNLNYTGMLRRGGNQDRMAEESMGPIQNRTREHLGTTDAAVIALRQMLAKAAIDVENGIEPPALDSSIPFHRIRPEDKILPAGQDWRAMATDADPDYVEWVPPGDPVYERPSRRRGR
jgi:hypothetical protein